MQNSVTYFTDLILVIRLVLFLGVFPILVFLSRLILNLMQLVRSSADTLHHNGYPAEIRIFFSSLEPLDKTVLYSPL
jgi:hypothetical protein